MKTKDLRKFWDKNTKEYILKYVGISHTSPNAVSFHIIYIYIYI